MARDQLRLSTHPFTTHELDQIMPEPPISEWEILIAGAAPYDSQGNRVKWNSRSARRKYRKRDPWGDEKKVDLSDGTKLPWLRKKEAS